MPAIANISKNSLCWWFSQLITCQN